MIKCPNCTGELKFKPEDQEVVCPYCGSKFDPKELNETVKMSGEHENVGTYEGKCYSCSQCGANLLTFDETAVTFCSYCGSQAMIESKMMKQNNPDFIIPFKKSKEDCIKEYKSKINKSLFAPGYMKSDIVLQKFRGIYLPYCLYKLERHGSTNNSGSKYAYRSGDYQYYNDFKITSDVDATYEGISFDLTSKYYDKYSTSIPFNFKEKEQFNPNYLIGYYADTIDVNSDIYESDSRAIAENDIAAKMKKNREFRKYGCNNPVADLNVTEKKIGMFPVYFLAIRNKDNKHVNYAIVNGQTGKVAMDMPISIFKYLIGSFILAVLLFLLIDAAIVIRPKTIAVISIISAILSLVLSISQANILKDEVYHKNDKGYTSIDKNKDEMNKKVSTFKYVYKEILAIVIPIAALFINFVDDKYYYGASLIALGLVILSFGDLVKEHNLISTNRLPQLEARGGDENE